MRTWPSNAKFCLLRRGRDGGPDTLETGYALSLEEEQHIDHLERAIVRRFWRLGCVCLRRLRPGHAASAHYAGTLPMTTEDRELTTDVNGRLRGTRAVYVADGSVFRIYLQRGSLLR